MTQETGLTRFGPFGLRPTTLVVTGHPSVDDYAGVLTWLRRVHSGVQWWIGDALNALERDYPEEYKRLVNATEWEENTVRMYQRTCAQVPVDNRLSGVPFGHYMNLLAALPPVQQRQWAERVAADDMTRSRLSTALRLAKRAEVYATGPVPDGPFRVCYADPPWAYDDSGVVGDSDAYGRAERHYPTMTIEQLCAMPVKDRMADDAVLFLWVTAPLLMQRPGPREVIEAWGFTGKTGMVWDKVAHNYGHYVSVRHEHLLICTRGSCTPDQPTPMPDSVHIERRPEVHSQKPRYFRDLIDQLYPHGRALELFGRQAAEGRWTVYGNEVAAGAAWTPGRPVTIPYDATPASVATAGGS